MNGAVHDVALIRAGEGRADTALSDAKEGRDSFVAVVSEDTSAR